MHIQVNHIKLLMQTPLSFGAFKDFFCDRTELFLYRVCSTQSPPQKASEHAQNSEAIIVTNGVYYLYITAFDKYTTQLTVESDIELILRLHCFFKEQTFRHQQGSEATDYGGVSCAFCELIHPKSKFW